MYGESDCASPNRDCDTDEWWLPVGQCAVDDPSATGHCQHGGHAEVLSHCLILSGVGTLVVPGTGGSKPTSGTRFLVLLSLPVSAFALAALVPVPDLVFEGEQRRYGDVGEEVVKRFQGNPSLCSCGVELVAAGLPYIYNYTYALSIVQGEWTVNP